MNIEWAVWLFNGINQAFITVRFYCTVLVENLANKEFVIMNRDFNNKEILKIIGGLADNLELEVYAVGGYVRDYLLGKEVKDIDFVVVGDGPGFAESVAQEVAATNVSIYKQFGTAMVKYQDLVLEFVGARRESYRGSSRKPDVKSADLLTDLTRRDFTINTMAVALNKEHYGQILDPFDGKKDLKAGIIRTPLDPEKTFFDDPLRIMRAIRFASQLHFSIEKKTKKGLTQECERLKIISQERITDELLKILLSSQPSVGFHLMSETGVLDVVLPEISALKGVDQIGKHGHKDVFLHTIKVMDNVAQVSADARLLWTALFHDVAKPATKEYRKGIGWTFHGHEELGARMMGSIGRRLRISNETILYIKKLIRLHLRPMHLVEEGVTDSAIRRLLFQAGEDVDDLITLCRADITSGNRKKVVKFLSNFDGLVKRMQEVEEKDHLRSFQPPVRGDEIMQVCGIKPGPIVGKIKTAIEEAILNGDIPNQHDSAYEYLLEIKDKILQEYNQ